MRAALDVWLLAKIAIEGRWEQVDRFEPRHKRKGYASTVSKLTTGQHPDASIERTPLNPCRPLMITQQPLGGSFRHTLFSDLLPSSIYALLFSRKNHSWTFGTLILAIPSACPTEDFVRDGNKDRAQPRHRHLGHNVKWTPAYVFLVAFYYRYDNSNAHSIELTNKNISVRNFYTTRRRKEENRCTAELRYRIEP